MMMFVGRKTELEDLKLLYDQPDKGLVVMKGRRRVGKSRLVAEFAARNSGVKFWSFSGVPESPETTAQDQRDEFAGQLSQFINAPKEHFESWSDAFYALAKHLEAGDIILFDEISWMGSRDHLFIPKLKDWWDRQTKKFLLVFCGSVSTWIEENILQGKAFYGRVNLTIHLNPLSIAQSAQLLRHQGFQGSPYEFYTLLNILGGVPWYLAQIKQGMTAEENIRRLAFQENGILVREFDTIFHDLFNGSGSVYKKVLDCLNTGPKTFDELKKNMGIGEKKKLENLMENLVIAGFVAQQDLWSFTSPNSLKGVLYRINDPYIRFYLKVMEPLINRIVLGRLKDVTLHTLPGFDIHLGLQLEHLLLQNYDTLLDYIGLEALSTLNAGPYRQQKTNQNPGCQIDYLVQSDTKNLYVCEFKFLKEKIGTEIVDSMKKRIESFDIPEGFTAIPILFHIGGVTEKVKESNYFYRIINIGDFLTP